MTPPKSARNEANARPEPWRRRLFFHLLLIAPFIGTLWVPFYNRAEPQLFGFPFFYWYQFLWIVIGAALTALAYFTTDGRRGR